MVYWGYIGIMEEKMKLLFNMWVIFGDIMRLYWGNAKAMEATIVKP